MKQIISDSIPTRFGYKVDKPFIDQVISIIQTASKQATFEIKIHAGSETYTFDSAAEFYDSVVTIVYRISQFTLYAYLPSDSIHSNTITIQFDSDSFYSFRTNSIAYDFSNDERNYHYLKEKLTPLLKAQQLPYTYFVGLPFLPVITLVDGFLFSALIEHILPFNYTVLFFLVIMNLFVAFRSYLFPKNEIAFGENVKQDHRLKKIRNFLLVGIILTIILNLSSNYIYDFIKQL